MRSFYDHFRPVFFVARIVGIFNFNNSANRHKICDILWSAPFIIYTLLIQTASELWGVDSIGTPAGEFSLRGTTLTSICLLKLITDYIWFVFRANKIEQILVKIDAITREINYEFPKPITNQVVAVLVTTIGFRLLLDTLNFYSEINIVMFGCIAEVSLIGLMTYIVYVVTTTIKELFASLNNRMKKLASNRGDLIMVIKDCTHIHFKLATVSRQFNDSFAFPLLGNALILFTLITIFTYQFIFKASNVGGFRDASIFDVLQDLFWALLLTCLYFLMVHSWDSVAREANETGLNVHRIWNIVEDNQQTSNADEQEIDEVSLRLMQNKLRFTVCRFVDLDWSLIHMVTQTVTMYLVWIIQLKA